MCDCCLRQKKKKKKHRIDAYQPAESHNAVFSARFANKTRCESFPICSFFLGCVVQIEVISCLLLFFIFDRVQFVNSGPEVGRITTK